MGATHFTLMCRTVTKKNFLSFLFYFYLFSLGLIGEKTYLCLFLYQPKLSLSLSLYQRIDLDKNFELEYYFGVNRE